MTNDANNLLSTTDPMVWSQEFCRIFDGCTITVTEDDPRDGRVMTIDHGTMLGWFANAFETGRREAAQAVCPHTDRFMLSEDLMACRNCGKLFE